MKKIMVIEDNKSIRESIMLSLEFNDYQVISAENGHEAIELLAITKDLPHLIILDINMPVMNGFEFRKEQLKDKRISNIPVVVLTAKNSLMDIKKEIQAYEFLNKPVDIHDVLYLLENFFFLKSRSAVTFA